MWVTTICWIKRGLSALKLPWTGVVLLKKISWESNIEIPKSEYNLVVVLIFQS